MSFVVGCNWDEKLIDIAAKYSVKELYGKIHEDIFGGGRPSFVLPVVTKEYIEYYIKKLHKNGVEFNYLLNNTCMNGIELTLKGQKKIRKYLDWLSEINVDSLTVTIPYLAEIIKKHYPNFNLTVSSFTKIQSVREAKYWEDLGANVIILNASRNFTLLKNLKKYVNCELEIMPNLSCLNHCPLNYSHSHVMSHASQCKDTGRGFALPFYELSCSDIKFSTPFKMISAPWIRPEDIAFYRDEIGIDRFKLIQRFSETELLHLIIKSYSEEKYKGNLADLLPEIRERSQPKGEFLKKIKYFFQPLRYNIFKSLKLKKVSARPKVYIDNQKLDGFLDFFKTHDCQYLSCEKCGYCQKIADKVITINDAQRQDVTYNFKDILNDFSSGSFFKYW